MKKTISQSRGGNEMPLVHHKSVENLTRRLSPVKPVAPPFRQWLSWLMTTSVLMILFIKFIPIRADLSSVLKTPFFDLMMIFIFLGAALSAWGAIDFSLPGEEKKGNWKIFTAFLFWTCACLLFLFFLPWETGKYSIHLMPLSCFEIVFFSGMFFWAGLVMVIKGNASINERKVGIVSGISSFLLSLGLITLHCDSQNLYHVFFEHFLPVLAYSWIVGWLGAGWFSAWKRKPLTNTP